MTSQHHRARAVLRETWGPVAVVAATVVVMAHLLGTGWLRYFLYDGDSLALPLLMQSVQAGEPFEWVMTSQIFLFPEIPLYLLSSLVSPSVQAALLVNGVLNALVLYALMRWIAARVLHGRDRVLQIGAAFAATATFLLLCGTEGRALVNTGAFATGYLLTTYYGGVLIAGLLCLALALEASGGFRGDHAAAPSRRVVVLALLGLFVVSALTTVSNPLFLLNLVAPFVGSVAILWLLNRLDAGRSVLLVGSVVVGAVGGYLARDLLARFIAVDAATYLHLDQAGVAVSTLLAQLSDIAATWPGKLQILLVVLLLLLALLGVVVAVFTQVRPELRARIDDAGLFLYCFVVLSAGVLVAAQVITGSQVSRYFVALGVFPTLGLVALAGGPSVRRILVELRRRVSTKIRRVGMIGSGILAVAAALLCLVVGVPPVAAAAEGTRSSADESCLASWIDGRPISGVGSFWTTRPLQLYGSSDIDVQQVNFDFSAQLWMNNLADYDGKTFRYVLADHDPDWAALAIAQLGEPAAVIGCESFDIYDYDQTAGEDTLNEIVGTSVRTAQVQRGD